MIDLKEYLKGKTGLVTAINAMCDGLERQHKRKVFWIDMSTFGKNDRGFCFGCAATCSIQEISSYDFTSTDFIEDEEDRAKKLNLVYPDSFYDFEIAINSFRNGSPKNLFNFCRVKLGIYSYQQNWELQTNNWKEQLPEIRKYVDHLMKEWNLEWEMVA